MKALLITVALAAFVAACGGTSPAPANVAPSPSATAKKRIPGIDRMGFEELSHWVTVCGPYNASLEGRAKNPYEPMDCDDVQFKHDSWRIPQTQKPDAYLPGFH